MPDYWRWCVAGGAFFFKLVTCERRRFLIEELPRRYLREAIATVRRDFPFEIVAIVLLPDHLHTVWTLPRGDDRYATRWRRIKEEFTETYLADGSVELPVSEARRKRNERGVWQRRFWEHTVHYEDDLKRCVDYIHWNPKKRGYVTRVRDWEFSTFHRLVERGEYDLDWGSADPVSEFDSAEWGE